MRFVKSRDMRSNVVAARNSYPAANAPVLDLVFAVRDIFGGDEPPLIEEHCNGDPES
jgi:hypothetical protein